MTHLTIQRLHWFTAQLWSFSSGSVINVTFPCINYSSVNMSFMWRHYRPITHGWGSEEQQESTGSLVSLTPSEENSPFSIYPNSGTMFAHQVTNFVVRFHPTKVNVLFTVAIL